jgi:ketosteroid isomerase-like protein
VQRRAGPNKEVVLDEDLKARIERLEAINDIRNLMADYTHYFDAGWPGAGQDAEKVGALFTEDAVWGGDAGAQTGRARIQSWCARYGHAAKMSLHIAMNPKIEVDGDRATGAWSGLIPMVTPDGAALWVGGRYECAFVRQNGDWKIAHMNFFTAFQTPYDEGFARTQFLDPAAYKPKKSEA